MEYVFGLRGVVRETLKPVGLPVKGTVPSWLHGAVYRNGPGSFDIERKNGTTFTFKHWFDGLTMMHKFDINNGSVTYCSRHLNPGQLKYLAEGGDASQGFGQDPCHSLFARAFTALIGGGPKDPVTGRKANPNVGVTVGMLQGKLVSRTDGNVLVEVIPDDLTPKPAYRYTDINPAFKGFLSAAHPQYDRNTGETFNFTTDFPGGKAQYNVFCIPEDPASQGWLLASIKALPAYIHSMAMTNKYIIFMVWPALLKPLSMMMGKSLLTSMHWEGATEGVSFYVLDRTKRGDAHVATYTSEAFYCFHNINAYQDGDDVIIDLLAYEDNSVVYDLQLGNLRDEKKVKGFSSKPPLLHRITLPNVSAAVKAGPDAKQQASMRCVTKELELELPRMHPAWQCKEYTWMYAVAMKTGESLWLDRIAKVNVNTGAMSVWREPGCFVGEPLFVPTPGGTAEDDGVLLVVALDGKQERSFLAVLDAQTMKEIARAEVPSVVPFGFHGNFISSQGKVVTETN